MQDVVRATNAQMALMSALSRFRYLTTRHMVRLGISPSLRHVQRALRDLTQRRRPLVGFLDFGAVPTLGKLHRVYYLTERGGDVLLDAGYDPQTVSWPQKVRLFPHDYAHRLNCIDFHISVALWATTNQSEFGQWDSYYDHGSIGSDGRAHPRSRVAWEQGSLVPDSIFMLTAEDGEQRLFAFEMHNGTDTARLTPKMRNYAQACRERVIETPYGYPASVRVLLIFEDENTLQKAGDRLLRDNVMEERSAQFFGHTLDGVSRDFRQGWRQLGTGQTSALF